MTTNERAELRMHVAEAARWLEELQAEARAEHPILSDVVECMDELEGRLRCIRRLMPEHLRARARRTAGLSVLASPASARGGV
jgi:hypothetical protein